MKLIPGRVAIPAGMKARFHRGDGLLFSHVVLPCGPDDFFQFQAQHPIQRRPLLCGNHLAFLDQLFVKTDGDILLQGNSSFFTRVLRITQWKEKNQHPPAIYLSLLLYLNLELLVPLRGMSLLLVTIHCFLESFVTLSLILFTCPRPRPLTSQPSSK